MQNRSKIVQNWVSEAPLEHLGAQGGPRVAQGSSKIDFWTTFGSPLEVTLGAFFDQNSYRFLHTFWDRFFIEFRPILELIFDAFWG